MMAESAKINQIQSKCDTLKTVGRKELFFYSIEAKFMFFYQHLIKYIALKSAIMVESAKMQYLFYNFSYVLMFSKGTVGNEN